MRKDIPVHRRAGSAELLNLSSRILVLRHGRVVGELSRAPASQDAALRLMAGLEPVVIPA